MPTADWTNEKIPGSPTTYDDNTIKYDDTTSVDGAGQMRYDSVSVTTEWTNENL